MSEIPILISFPESFETERLLIRAPQWGDGVFSNEAIGESLEQLKPWMPFAQTMPTAEQSEAYVRKARLNFLERTDLPLHLFDKQTGEFVGSSGLHRFDWDVRRFEIGYWLRTSRLGQGLMTEAVNGITAFAIQELNASRIEIHCNEMNHASARVAERAGFTLEGILRKSAREQTGELANTCVYAKVKGYEF
ncbi:GNAT family N-acetyltransferase [Paenibacillus algorifonticola]|uniref:GNAT family N-acetyltransferase n=1 Tax=Paenibacillus algorifonticola TaxID=684063 RepID=UPI003D276252